MADAMEIAPNEGMPALPPLPPVAPVVHAPGEGVGKNWPLASAGIAVAVAATLHPRDAFSPPPIRGRGEKATIN